MIFAGEGFGPPTSWLWAKHSSSELPRINKKLLEFLTPSPVNAKFFWFGFFNRKKCFVFCCKEF